MKHLYLQNEALGNDNNSFCNSESSSKIYLHSSVMSSLSINRNCCMLVNSDNGAIILKCHPCDTIDVESAALHSTLYKFYTASPILIEPIPLDLHAEPAKEVYILPEESREFMLSQHFKAFFKKTIESLYIRPGLVLNLDYLGYSCFFTIKHITSHLVSSEAIKELCKNSVNTTIEAIDTTNLVFNATQTSTPKLSRKDPSRIIRGTKKEKFYFLNSQTKIVLGENISAKISLKNVLGLNEVINFVKASVLVSGIQNPFPKKILLIGPAGSGKSMIGQGLKNEHNFPPVEIIKCKSIENSKYEDKTYFEKVFEEACQCSPCVLYLDDFDALFSDEDSMKKNSLVFRNLDFLLHEYSKPYYNLVVIATANSKNSLMNDLFEKDMHLMLSSDGRKQVLLNYLQKLKHKLNEEEIDEFVGCTENFTAGQLQKLCEEASSSHPPITLNDLKKCLKPTTTSCSDIPSVLWSDIAGMHEVKEALEEMVEWPLKLSRQFKRFRVQPSKGVLLYGPPGCCKTMIARALATKCNLNFIPVQLSELLNKYVGESEKEVSELFKRAASIAPCILFFDEIDSLTSSRNRESSSRVSDRIVTQLLTEMDGVEPLNGVSILAATNKLHMIDPSFLRPGRFDEKIYVPLPDDETREEIFNINLKKMPLSPDVDLSYLVKVTEGYSGAEISGVCRAACMKCMQEDFSSTVSMKHLASALLEVKAINK